MSKIIWEKFFTLAEELSKTNEEEYLRSAISRYYYSLFNLCRFYLVNVMNEYEFDSKNNIHTKIIKRMINSNDYNEFEIGKNLKYLRNRRNNADYDLKFKCTNENISNISDITNNSIDIINSLILNPPFKLK